MEEKGLRPNNQEQPPASGREDAPSKHTPRQRRILRHIDKWGFFRTANGGIQRECEELRSRGLITYDRNLFKGSWIKPPAAPEYRVERFIDPILRQHIAHIIDQEFWNALVNIEPIRNERGRLIGYRLLDPPILTNPRAVKSLAKADAILRRDGDAKLSSTTDASQAHRDHVNDL